MDVYLEIGQKRVFAAALDWPGWSRSGRDEAGALQALVDSAPRYALALSGSGLDFRPPLGVANLTVVERVVGNATTDFGAPDMSPAIDERPVDAAELARFGRLLEAYWEAFDKAAKAAEGKELRKGPRGGGRDLEGIIRHVYGADGAYLSRLGRKLRLTNEDDLDLSLAETRRAVLEALAASARGEVPAQGPRGGAMWSARQGLRRIAWHVLDHAWEIEDRVQ